MDGGKPRHARVLQVAFKYKTFDELPGTYARLRGLGILPTMAIDEGLPTGFYYTDPDLNGIDLKVSHHGNDYMAAEHTRTAQSSAERRRREQVDPDEMVAAQGGRFAVRNARACLRRGVRPSKAVRPPHARLSRGTAGFERGHELLARFRDPGPAGHEEAKTIHSRRNRSRPGGRGEHPRGLP
jgi:hypothetical protein